jgi:hypothetical protein
MLNWLVFCERLGHACLYWPWFPQASYHASQQTQWQRLNGYQDLRTHSPPPNHTPKVWINIRGVVPSRVWAVGLLLGSFWDWNGHGSCGFHHIFSISMCLDYFQWSLSFYPEVCRMNSIKIHDFRWNGELRWVGYARAAWRGSRRKTNCLWYVWKDGNLLFSSLVVKRWHKVGSTCSKHWAHNSQLVVSGL